jgi:hypothetical protein
MMIELVETLACIGGGKGGYWQDQGYARRGKNLVVPTGFEPVFKP